jgi:hypothetical protein
MSISLHIGESRWKYPASRQDKQHGQARTSMVKHPKHLKAGRDVSLVATTCTVAVWYLKPYPSSHTNPKSRLLHVAAWQWRKKSSDLSLFALLTRSIYATIGGMGLHPTVIQGSHTAPSLRRPFTGMPMSCPRCILIRSANGRMQSFSSIDS